MNEGHQMKDNFLEVCESRDLEREEGDWDMMYIIQYGRNYPCYSTNVYWKQSWVSWGRIWSHLIQHPTTRAKESQDALVFLTPNQLSSEQHGTFQTLSSPLAPVMRPQSPRALSCDTQLRPLCMSLPAPEQMPELSHPKQGRWSLFTLLVQDHIFLILTLHIPYTKCPRHFLSLQLISPPRSSCSSSLS